MIDTTDLSSYYPGYDEYCEPKKEQRYIEVDDIVEEIKIREEND